MKGPGRSLLGIQHGSRKQSETTLEDGTYRCHLRGAPCSHTPFPLLRNALLPARYHLCDRRSPSATKGALRSNIVRKRQCAASPRSMRHADGLWKLAGESGRMNGDGPEADAVPLEVSAAC